jgi:hypothetical protein
MELDGEPISVRLPDGDPSSEHLAVHAATWGSLTDVRLDPEATEAQTRALVTRWYQRTGRAAIARLLGGG